MQPVLGVPTQLWDAEMQKGQHDDYYWLASTEGSLCELVIALPQLVIGKRVVVTAFDSGPL